MAEMPIANRLAGVDQRNPFYLAVALFGKWLLYGSDMQHMERYAVVWSAPRLEVYEMSRSLLHHAPRNACFFAGFSARGLVGHFACLDVALGDAPPSRSAARYQ